MDRTLGHPPKKRTRAGLRKLMPDQVGGAKEAILWALEGGQNVISACRMVNISRSTFYDWLRRDAVFAEAVEAVRWPHYSHTADRTGALEELSPFDGVSTPRLISMLKRLNPVKYGRHLPKL